MQRSRAKQGQDRCRTGERQRRGGAQRDPERSSSPCASAQTDRQTHTHRQHHPALPAKVRKTERWALFLCRPARLPHTVGSWQPCQWGLPVPLVEEHRAHSGPSQGGQRGHHPWEVGLVDGLASLRWAGGVRRDIWFGSGVANHMTLGRLLPDLPCGRPSSDIPRLLPPSLQYAALSPRVFSHF